MGKVEAGQLDLEHQPFRLSELRSDAEAFALAATKKGLEFFEETHGATLDGYLIGDRLRLRQVHVNFLSNAVKFTNRGSITLRLKAEEGSRASETIVILEVEDTGCGI